MGGGGRERAAKGEELLLFVMLFVQCKERMLP